MIWILLLLLGIVLYVTVRYNVAQITTTPWWILWLVLMIPAFVYSILAVTRPQQPVPIEWVIASFLFSTLVYLLLLNQTRRFPPPSQQLKQAQQTKLSPLTQDEEHRLHQCFPWSVYFLKEIETRPQAVVCRGQLRSQPEVAYQTIQENIRTQFGNRFLVVFQIGAANQPFFALVPNPEVQGSRQQQRPLTRPFLALGLLLTTLLTTTLVGVEMAKEELTRDMFAQNPTLLFLGLPYAIALIVILGTHELGHYLTARYYRIKATLPYFIPIPFALGTFGAFIQMRSPVPNRKALFDVGIAGPIAGFVVTLPLIIWGLMHSEVVPLPDKPDLSALSPNLSILFALLSKITLGANLTLNDGIQLHPVAVAGCLGLVITALNLMPVGQLDGGHIVHAMYGQRTGSIIGQVSRILVLLLALSIQPLLRFWAIILLFIPATDEPALNDVSELNSSRDLLGLAALGILLLIVLPVPHSFTHLLFATNPVP